MERIQASCSSQQEKRNNAPNPRSIPNREAFQRMSFLYQASAYLNNVGIALQQSGCSSQRNKIPKGRTEDLGENADENLDADEYDRDANAGGSLRSLADTNGKKRASSKRMATLDDLGATYINDLRVIGTKSVLRMFVFVSISSRTISFTSFSSAIRLSKEDCAEHVIRS